VDFVSNAQIGDGTWPRHAKYHIEVEGLLPAATIKSLPAAAEAIAALVAPDVDEAEAQENAIAPGVNVDMQRHRYRKSDPDTR